MLTHATFQSVFERQREKATVHFLRAVTQPEAKGFTVSLPHVTAGAEIVLSLNLKMIITAGAVKHRVSFNSNQ